jgi:branched-chain amino acid transport system substrate-binding protein
MMVQYRGIKGNSVDQWKQPGIVTVLEPGAYKTGAVKAPYQDAKN